MQPLGTKVYLLKGYSPSDSFCTFFSESFCTFFIELVIELFIHLICSKTVGKSIGVCCQEIQNCSFCCGNILCLKCELLSVHFLFVERHKSIMTITIVLLLRIISCPLSLHILINKSSFKKHFKHLTWFIICHFP